MISFMRACDLCEPKQNTRRIRDFSGVSDDWLLLFLISVVLMVVGLVTSFFEVLIIGVLILFVLILLVAVRWGWRNREFEYLTPERARGKS